MKKDEIFFGENGLTSTHATYLSNVAKEHYQQVEKELQNIRFFDTRMSLIGSGEEQIISEGVTSVSDVNAKLEKIARLKSLIAWFRESVKSRERLFAEVNNLTFKDCGLVAPEEPERPERETYITEDDVVGGWNIKQRNRYYYLETLCAQIGKFIHVDGVFSRERQNLLDKIQNPRNVKANGRDTLVYHYIPSIDSQEVEDKYMELQDTYRSYQAELNSMKHEIEVAVEKDKVAKDNDYQKRWTEYQKEYTAYSQKLIELNNKLTCEKNERLEKVQKMKIIVPDALKGVYEEVSSLGKKN